MRNKKKSLADYYGMRVYSPKLGKGILVKVYGDEIHFKFDDFGVLVYRSDPFENGTVFTEPELLKGFMAAYRDHVNSENGRFEMYDTWFRRGS